MLWGSIKHQIKFQKVLDCLVSNVVLTLVQKSEYVMPMFIIPNKEYYDIYNRILWTEPTSGA